MAILMDSLANAIKPFTDYSIKAAKRSGWLKMIETTLVREVVPHLLVRSIVLVTAAAVAALFVSFCPSVSLIAGVIAINVALDCAVICKKAHSAYTNSHGGPGRCGAELFRAYKNIHIFCNHS